MTEIKIGQLWRECDPRIHRLVRVLAIREREHSIHIRTVIKVGDGSVDAPCKWIFPPHSRPTWCDRERFNGKRGGYELYEDVP